MALNVLNAINAHQHEIEFKPIHIVTHTFITKKNTM